MTISLVIDIIHTLISVIYHLLESCVLLLLPKKKKDVSNDIVLVTGAGSGLGKCVAIQFAKFGSTVVLWDVNEKGNLETKQMITDHGGKAFAYTCDLCNKNDVYKMAERVKNEVGKVSILINNAGIVTGKTLLLCPDNMIEKTFAVNILAHFWTVKAFLPDMLHMKKGHIVTIASLAGYFGINQLVDYSSSKSAAIGFHDTLTAELRANGFKTIQTTVVCPIFVNTGMFEGVQSRVFPILTPENVCDSIVNAVLTNSREVILPRFVTVFFFFKSILPMSVFDDVLDLLINVSTMEKFRGRRNNVYLPDKTN